MTNGIITLVPLAGLCNRLQAMQAGVELAESLGCSLRVVWMVDGVSLGARYRDLFKQSRHFTLFELDYGRALGDRLKGALLGLRTDKKVCLWLRSRSHDLILGVEETRVRLGPEGISSLKGKKVLIETYCDFYGQVTGMPIFAEPISDLQIEIDKYVSDLPHGLVGLHVRRGDHKPATSESTLNAFCDVLDMRLNANPGEAFFLASDSPSVVDELHSRYPGRIFSRAKKYGRSTVFGIRDAVIDLYLLSQCTEILGSYGSSFSEMAARIGTVPLQVVRK